MSPGRRSSRWRPVRLTGPSNYTSGTGSATLTFNYTVQAGDTSADLDYVNTTALSAGTSIRDAALNDADRTLAAPGAAGSLGANKNLVIDTTPPTVTNVTSPTADGSYKAGTLIPVTVTFSEVVHVTGTPQLTLSTGSPATTAVNYVGGTGTDTLTFNYTVAAGNTSADLNYASTGSLALNGGTIQDTATNNATLTLPATGSGNSLAGTKAIVIDTTASTVISVTSPTANGSYSTGTLIPVTVIFSEVVHVTGTPQLTLSTGSPATTTVNYVSGTGTNTLTFNYTVAAGNTSADLDYAAINSLALNGGTIQDTATNNATLTLPATGSANSLAGNKAIVIDTAAPTVSSVALNNGSGTAGRVDDGDTIVIQFSEQMAVNSFCSTWSGNGSNQNLQANGDVTLTLADGGAGNDSITVASGTCSFNFGSISLASGAYITSGSRTYNGTMGSTRSEISWNAGSRTLTIMFGNNGVGGTIGTVSGNTIATYNPSATITDVAGNGSIASKATANAVQF